MPQAAPRISTLSPTRLLTPSMKIGTPRFTTIRSAPSTRMLILTTTVTSNRYHSLFVREHVLPSGNATNLLLLLLYLRSPSTTAHYTSSSLYPFTLATTLTFVALHNEHYSLAPLFTYYINSLSTIALYYFLTTHEYSPYVHYHFSFLRCLPPLLLHPHTVSNTP